MRKYCNNLFIPEASGRGRNSDRASMLSARTPLLGLRVDYFGVFQALDSWDFPYGLAR